MELTVFTPDQLVKRWGYAPSTIRKMEAEGKLHRLPNMPGVRYSAAEVYQLESIGLDARALSAWERRNLEAQIRDKDAIIARLQKKLADIMEILMMEVRHE